MLRLRDSRTGSYAVLDNPMIPVRVCVHGPAAGTWTGRPDLRVLLVADVLTRIAELQGLETITVVAGGHPLPARLDDDLGALGIHPPAALADYGETASALGGPAHVHVATGAAGGNPHTEGVLLDVAPASGAAEPAGDDLLALRLTLLSSAYREPVTLTPAALAEASESVSRWRRRVAEWATQPSRPIPAESATVIRDAFDDDLNTVAAVDLLRGLESRPDIPAGAKFETFLFVDRVLGLELPREIGR